MYDVTFSSPSHKVSSGVPFIFFAAGVGIFFSECEVWAQGNWWKGLTHLGYKELQLNERGSTRKAHWLHWGERSKNNLGSGCRGSGHYNCYMYRETVYQSQVLVSYGCLSGVPALDKLSNTKHCMSLGSDHHYSCYIQSYSFLWGQVRTVTFVQGVGLDGSVCLKRQSGPKYTELGRLQRPPWYYALVNGLST